MAYRRRRRRAPRRSRWRHRRRPYYWRRYHRGYHRRRRRYPRLRTAQVRYYPSRRRKRISVRGWEPLGNICPTDSASAEATPYKDLDVPPYKVENTEQCKGQWHGQWGHHYFTFRSLLLRANYYFNYWSGDWEGYDYLSFKGGYIWLPRMPGFSWMFYLDPAIQSNPTEDEPEGKYKADKSWVHPGIFLNRPGARLMLSTLQSKGRNFYRKLKVTPPSNWEGNYRMDVAMDYLLIHWSWTTVNVTSPFYDFWCQNKAGRIDADQCNQCPWWIADKEFSKYRNESFMTGQGADKLYEEINKFHQDSRSAWVNRKKYIKSDCTNTGGKDKAPANFHNWGPFLPQNVLLSYQTGYSLYFRYKLYFKVSGDSLYRRLPSTPCTDTVFPPAPGTSKNPCPEISPRSILKKRRPPSIYDILPGDLDEGGLLTDGAYRRITGSSGAHESTPMVSIPHTRVTSRKRVRIREPDGIRKRKRARQLIRLHSGGRGEPGGGGPPPNPPPVTEPLDLLLNFPK
uniref:Capsid protein n=1 Tax=Torque teno Leptonychotes weddellii virus-1 TaxID=2012676 RepID=A0A1Z2RWU9_9VIRU|nr:ORF1 [Torque teno Leptonychotes weddellii virus 1]